jgi:hypothetical protein
VCLFETGEQARAWGDGPMRDALGSHPGISDIEVRYFDVDERLSAVTRGAAEGGPLTNGRWVREPRLGPTSRGS